VKKKVELGRHLGTIKDSKNAGHHLLNKAGFFDQATLKNGPE
jgi:hypothetical protein